MLTKKQLEMLSKDRLIELILELQPLKADPLTGCLRREALDNLAMDYYVVAMIDINNLKEINDAYGHEAGDAHICKVVSHIRSVVRATDKVVRYGGDEFLILFSSITLEQAKAVTSRIPADLAACGTGEGTTLKKALAAADEQMYKHKSLHKSLT